MLAALEELWFLGDLLGIFCLSAMSVFFFFGVLASLAIGVLGSLALVFGLVAAGVLEIEMLSEIDGFQKASSSYVCISIFCADDI